MIGGGFVVGGGPATLAGPTIELGTRASDHVWLHAQVARLVSDGDGMTLARGGLEVRSCSVGACTLFGADLGAIDGELDAAVRLGLDVGKGNVHVRPAVEVDTVQVEGIAITGFGATLAIAYER
jgi:hypothetical protein